MSDFPEQRLDDIASIARTLWFLPPPARTQLAPQLYDLGVRVHPELATKQLVREGPSSLGNHAPQRVESIGAMDALRKVNPVLAERIEAARAAAAAGDDSQARALADELRPNLEADRALLARNVGNLADLLKGDVA